MGSRVTRIGGWRRRQVRVVVALALGGLLATGCPGDGGDPSASLGGARPAAWFVVGDGRVTARYAGDDGFRPISEADSVTLMAVDVEGERVSAVCVERDQGLEADQVHAVRTGEEAGLEAPRRLAWLAANHATVPAPLEGDDERAAVQLAAWYLEGELGMVEIDDERLAARVEQLVAASEGQVAPAGPTRVVLELHPGGWRRDPHVQLLADGVPMADQPVEVEVDGVAQELVTGADGTVAVEAGPEAAVSARWEGTLPAGTVLEPAAERGQALMTLEPVTLVRTDRLTVGA